MGGRGWLDGDADHQHAAGADRGVDVGEDRAVAGHQLGGELGGHLREVVAVVGGAGQAGGRRQSVEPAEGLGELRRDFR